MLACLVSLVLVAGFTPRSTDSSPENAWIVEPGVVVDAPRLAASSSSLREIAQRDPERLAAMSLERLREVRDYTCVFLKQENIGGRLTPVQEIDVRFRAEPLSVYMKWNRNEDGARRALYIKGRHTANGQEQALVEPAGVIARLFVSETLVPIHGDRSRRASRRAIDEFGFKATLDLLTRFNALARARGVLDISYAGDGVIDGRPTLIIRRYLPYTGAGCGFPDGRMDLHFDQETMLPVAVYSWADREGKELLGSYVYTRVVVNPGLTDEAFRF